LRRCFPPLRSAANRAVTIKIEVKPQTIGRVLGIGLRAAGRIAGQGMAAGHQVSTSTVPTRAAGQVAGKATRGVAKGLGGFLRPFSRIGGTLWLEVTGVFFLLPVVVFGPTAWRTRFSWAHGPDHRTFLVACVIVALFSYLSATSFLRARRR
jgi:hypothetical protein